jgi:hypothetical protein
MRFIHVLTLIVTMTAICRAQSEKPRVFISDSNSWETSGGFVASRGSASGSFSGGARPQTVEIIKTFGQRCQSVVVTMDKSKADYVVLFDREGGKGIVLKHDKIAVFKKDGDALYSGSTRSVGNAVQDSCEAIERQSSNKWIAPGFQTETVPKDASIPKGVEIAVPAMATRSTNSDVSIVKPTEPSSVTTTKGITARIKSTPSNAEVDIDGVYWGTTPTADLTRLPAGTHTIVVRKIGYKAWERKIDLAGGDDRTVNAELEIDPSKPRIAGL